MCMCADGGGTKYICVCLCFIICLFVYDLFHDALKLGFVTWNFMIKAYRELNMGARKLSRPALRFSPGIRLFK